MSSFEHDPRGVVIGPHQHIYRHSTSEFAYTHSTLPGITNLQEALDWVFNVFYPYPQDAVDTPGDLPSSGNSIGDYRVVTDDGDGNAAGYQWQQREGDSAAKWYKITDMDWGYDQILSGFLSKTLDFYVYKHGYDDLDSAGTAFTGVNAGQHIFGGASANSHLTLHANAGDGVGAQTGYIQCADNARPQVDSTWSLGTTTERWLKIWSDEVTVGTVTIAESGAFSDSSGTLATADAWRIDGGLKDANVSTAINIGDASNTAFGTSILTSGSSFVGAINQLQASVSAMDCTGVDAWAGAGAYYSISSGDFTVLRAGTGFINGKAVSWAGGQTVDLSASNTLHYVYIDSTGTIGTTTSMTGLYTSYIVLFEVLQDGVNLRTVREDHPYNAQTSLSLYLHNNVGIVIRGTGAIITRVATGTGAAAGDRQVKIVGADVLEDHGLETTIADSAGAGVVWNIYYTDGSGNWVMYSQATELPMFYNAAGTPTALNTSGASSVGAYVLYISKDDKNTATPTYYAVMNAAAYDNNTQALSAVGAGTVSIATNELAGLELAQLGYAVVDNNVAGGYIYDLTVSKSTFNTKLVGGGAVGSAALISVNSGAFSGWLTVADTTVQLALETLDALKSALPVDNLLLDGNTISSTDTNGSIIIDPNGTGLIELGAAYYPETDSAWDIGKTGKRWNDLWIDGNIQDGTTTFSIANLMTFATVGAPNSGDALFWDGAKWAASAPDTEVDHGTISGLGDDDHSQYVMVAGRTGGTQIYGSDTTAENLTLSPNSAAANGAVIWTTLLRPTGNGAEDLGDATHYIKDIYVSGQLKSARLENYTTAGRPASSAAGRAIFDTDLNDVLVDTGAVWLKMSIDRWEYEDAATWDGSTATVTYTVDGSDTPARGRVSDSRQCIWQFKDNSNNHQVMDVKIDHPSATQVRVTSMIDLPAGTYRLIGIG